MGRGIDVIKRGGQNECVIRCRAVGRIGAVQSSISSSRRGRKEEILGARETGLEAGSSEIGGLTRIQQPQAVVEAAVYPRRHCRGLLCSQRSSLF